MSRGPESPMDYEWDNKTGPVDSQSPFLTARKRPHSVLDSPSKGLLGAYHTPNRLHLREPHSERVYFSGQTRPLTAVPSHVQESSTWEPRTPNSAIDFSSGGETPNTPAQDSEAETPGTQMADKLGRLTTGDGQSKSPRKNRRESWTGQIKSMFSSSPSPLKESRKAYSTKAENRVMKRRSKTRKLALREGYESDDNTAPSEAQGGANAQQIPGQPGYARQAGDFFSWVEAHPHLPSVLSTWFQLLVNSLLGLSFLYVIYIIYSGVQADVNIEASKYEAEALRDISLCHKQYTENRCDPATRVPAMEHACGNWYACMNRDPKQIAKASVTARTFANIFNSFVQEFSYKSMIFAAVMIFGGFNLSNWAFGVLRTKHIQQQHLQHQQQLSQHQADFYPPPTPQRHPSGGFIDQQGFYTPYQTPYVSGNQHALVQATKSLPTLPSTESGVSNTERRRSPTKRKLFS